MGEEHITPELELQLLRRFEPLLRFTRGEAFFPMDVEPYVRACSLWVLRPDEEAVCQIPQGELTLETLAQPRRDRGPLIHFLRFIEPLDILQLLTYVQKKRKRSKAEEAFRVGLGRLARVGYSSRVADLLFSLSLLLRGRVPGDTSAAAALEYGRIQAEQKHYSYHGRVVCQQDWIVLQYWFFYAFNNWRSGFFGVNDHEGDWEMINVYLYEAAPGEYVPEWVAYASHDFSGDNLRRRWDDPELHKEGEHPVVYAGAGSHASYYAPGEYLAEIDLPFLSPVARVVNWLKTGWNRLMGRKEHDSSDGPAEGVNVFWVPFVDYARGDGLTIGPGGKEEWDAPRLLDSTQGWVSQYTGLWGLFARDPISGENAPAGPMYNREGTIRRVWYDPVGWAGLDKLPPPNQFLARLHQQQTELGARQAQRQAAIAQKEAELTGLGVVNLAVHDRACLQALDGEQKERIDVLSSELAELKEQGAADQKLAEALDFYEKRLLAGQRDPARMHIRRAHKPASDSELRANRVVELWAALSIGLLMIGFVGLALFYRQHLILGLVAMISLFVFVESGFRRQLDQLINSVAIGLATVAALLILFEFFWQIVVFAVLFAGVYILWENLHELVS
jgi:hypothetical protein